MRVFLDSVGCRLNEAELATWRLGFREAGHGVVAQVEDADVAVFNSCAVTLDAARSSRKSTRRLHRLNPMAKIVLTGCYASLDPEEAAGIAGVDLVVPNAEKHDLVPTVLKHLPRWEMPASAQEAQEVEPSVDRSRAFVKVQDGCRHKCTYCIVTVARGKERSRSVGEIVGEINQRTEEGHSEVVLTGVHLGGYGSDIGEDLVSLLAETIKSTSIPRIRIGSLEPWRLNDSFFELWQKSDRLMPHLHLPLQSGSDTVLRRMARRCTRESYSRLVSQARKSIEGLHLSTDLIVGFPGESELEFEETLDFGEAMGFGQVHIFSYSPRPGTHAARLPKQLDRATKRERSGRLHDAANRWKSELLKSAIGERHRVLWERPRNDLSWQGYTESYLPVVAPAPKRSWKLGLLSEIDVQGVDPQGRLLADGVQPGL